VKEQHLIEFLRELGCTNISGPNADGRLVTTCPFAQWNHSGGTDSSPSFAVWVNDEGPSGYNCLAGNCDATGYGLKSLLDLLKQLSKQSWPGARRLVRQYEVYTRGGRRSGTRDFAASARRQKKRRSAAVDILSEFPEGEQITGRIQQTLLGSVDVERPILDEAELNAFSREYHPYIRDRGFSFASWDAWGLMVDESKHGDRIVFPIRDSEGQLLAFSRRVTWDKARCQWCGAAGEKVRFGSRRKSDEPKTKGGCPRCNNGWIWPKYQHSKGFKRNLYLYGEHLVDPELRKAVIVEGNLDPIRLWQLGVRNALATLGSKPGEGFPDPARQRPAEQLYRLGTMFDDILVLADGDAAGKALGTKVEKFFRGWDVSVRVKQCPEGRDPGDLESGQLIDLIGDFGVVDPAVA
jgi:5S rRNA maturation endonuclease (ribonuclease M5)